jgi:hypothetical protein
MKCTCVFFAMRKFQICTKSHGNLPKMHKISWLTWNNAQNPMRNFQNVHYPMRNSQIISSFHFFSTKYVFWQHAYWLIATIAGCNQFKTSSCNNEYPGNTTKVDAEEVDCNICLAKMYLIRTKPKVKGWNGHVYPLPWGNSKNVQNPTRNLQKWRCTSLELSQIIFMIWYDFSYIFYFNNFYCKQAMVRVNYWW